MSGVVRASMDVALEVLADGFSCEAALAEWMLRLSDQGLRYCPLAQEQILLSCIDEEEEEPDLDFPVEPTEAELGIPEEGSLIIPELEVVPQPEELASEQGKLPPLPLPPVFDPQSIVPFEVVVYTYLYPGVNVFHAGFLPRDLAVKNGEDQVPTGNDRLFTVVDPATQVVFYSRFIAKIP